HILRSMGVEGSEVLLGAVDGPIIEKALKSAALAGLSTEGLTLSSVGLVNSLLFSRREGVRGRTIAILSLGLHMLDIVLVQADRVLMAGSVQMDLRGVLEAWVGGRPVDGPRPDVGRLALAARMIDCLNLNSGEAAPETPGQPSAARLVEGWMDRIVQELRR